MPDESAGEKSLPASPMRRQKAREEGNVAKSQDLNAAVTLLAALFAFRFLGWPLWEAVVESSYALFARAPLMDMDLVIMHSLAVEMMQRLGLMLAPLMLALILAGMAVNVLQVGFLIAPKSMQPRFSKINPFTGFKKFFNARTGVELLKSIAKIIIVSVVVYVTLRNRWQSILLLSFLSPTGIVLGMAELIFIVWFRVAVAMLVLGLLDYAFQYYQREKEMRMTVQEAREELRQVEGDPRIRQRVRQVQRQLAMQRMMRDVPTADVIITNPTTYAVALRYDAAKMAAPLLVAKGARLVADRIRNLAIEHKVPIVEKPELARRIYRTVEIDQPVPEDLFMTVAEVLAFVYRIDRRAEKIRERRLADRGPALPMEA